MNVEIALTCPGCNTPFEADYSPQIDVVAFPALEQSVIAGTLNVVTCPQCGQKTPQKLPYVYWHKDWVGVVLEMGASVSAEEAIRQSNHLLQITEPKRDRLPSQVRVLSDWDDLVTLLQNPQHTAYTYQLMDQVVRNWSEPMILVSLSDAFLKAEMPEYAFWVYAFMIEYIPDLYFNSQVREALEITALEAGDKLVPMTENGKSVAKQLEEIEHHVKSWTPSVNRFGDYDLIWYIPIPPSHHGLTELKTSIEEKPISEFEQAQARLLTMFLVYKAKKLLPTEDEEVEAFRPLITGTFWFSWEKISRKEQVELENLWKQLAGSSLIDDTGLRLRDGMGRLMTEQESAEQWIEEGLFLSDSEHYEEALVAYEQAIRLTPDDANGYISKGNTLARLQRYEQALVAYERAIDLAPDNALAYYNQGSVLQLCQRYEEALAAYDQAFLFDLSEVSVNAYANKGSVLSELERYEEALAMYEQAVCLDPTDCVNVANKGITLWMLDRREEALAALEEAIRLDPSDAQLYHVKATLLEELGRSQEAQQAFALAEQFGYSQ